VTCSCNASQHNPKPRGSGFILTVQKYFHYIYGPRYRILNGMHLFQGNGNAAHLYGRHSCWGWYKWVVWFYLLLPLGAGDKDKNVAFERAFLVSLTRHIDKSNAIYLV
jgi:hypothetical protein